MTSAFSATSRAFALVAVIAAGSASAAEAPRAANPAARNVALNICARCHDISVDAKTAQRVTGAAPAFVTVAADPQMNRDRLLKFLRFPHGEMDNVFLTRRETEGVVDYILNMRTK